MSENYCLDCGVKLETSSATEKYCQDCKNAAPPVFMSPQQIANLKARQKAFQDGWNAEGMDEYNNK